MIFNEEGGNDHTKLGGAMHFNVRKCCIPLYDDEGDWEGIPEEEENGNVWIRQAIGMQMVECLDEGIVPHLIQGQTLKYNRPHIDGLNIRSYLVRDCK